MLAIRYACQLWRRPILLLLLFVFRVSFSQPSSRPPGEKMTLPRWLAAWESCSSQGPPRCRNCPFVTEGWPTEPFQLSRPLQDSCPSKHGLHWEAVCTAAVASGMLPLQLLVLLLPSLLLAMLLSVVSSDCCWSRSCSHSFYYRCLANSTAVVVPPTIIAVTPTGYC